MDEWVKLISQVGFPIVMTLWFMLRLEKRWDKQLELLAQILELQRIILKNVTGDSNHGRRK